MSKAGDTAKGAAGGAATGAAIGSIVPGYGTAIGAGVGAIAGGIGGYLSSDSDEEKRAKALQAQRDAFAAQARASYDAYTQRAGGSLDYLQAQAQGQNSVSAEQLRQALQQNYATQQSMAAGASPRNAAMAARTASIQSARLGAGLAGAQAQAGLQERNQAQQQYAQLLQGLRGQDLQAATGVPYSAPAQPSMIDKYGPALQAGLNAYIQSRGRQAPPAAQSSAPARPNENGAAMNSWEAAVSDRRLKKGIRDGEDDAGQALGKLKAQSFEYKDAKHGAGRRVGIMAQGLERAGLGHAVIDTPQGKAIHGGHLATSLAAMMPGLAKRISALEKQGK